MKNNKNRLIITVMLILSALVAQEGLAANSIFAVAAGAWETAANWGGTLPGAADTVFIRQGRTATISSDVGSISTFNIGDSYGAPPYTGTLTINSGKLVVNSDAACIGRQADGAIGIVNLNGGTLQFGDTTGNQRVWVGLDTAGKISQGFLNINGGTFIGSMIVGSTDVSGANEDMVTITGSSATVGNSSSARTALDLRATGVIKFVFDASGISAMNFTVGTATFGAGSKIIVDGSAYTGPDATFNLITAGTLGAQNATVILTNCAAGTTYSWNQTTDIVSVNMKGPMVKGLKLFMVK